MYPNPQLDRIIARETFAEILSILTPRELAVVALRLEDRLDFKHAAELLGVSQQAARDRMKWARRRILKTYPHIRSLVELDS
jgi:DNA-directed RNA polymerase specialized sigma24 family protein